MTLYDEGQHEALKGAVHGAMIPLCALAFAYNWQVCRRPERREWWHVVNVGLYGAVLMWEMAQVARHAWRGR